MSTKAQRPTSWSPWRMPEPTCLILQTKPLDQSRRKSFHYSLLSLTMSSSASANSRSKSSTIDKSSSRLCHMESLRLHLRSLTMHMTKSLNIMTRQLLWSRRPRNSRFLNPSSSCKEPTKKSSKSASTNWSHSSKCGI